MRWRASSDGAWPMVPRRAPPSLYSTGRTGTEGCARRGRSPKGRSWSESRSGSPLPTTRATKRPTSWSSPEPPGPSGSRASFSASSSAGLNPPGALAPLLGQLLANRVPISVPEQVPLLCRPAQIHPGLWEERQLGGYFGGRVLAHAAAALRGSQQRWVTGSRPVGLNGAPALPPQPHHPCPQRRTTSDG